VPLLAGLFWRGASTAGAAAAAGAGLATWLACAALAPDALVPPNLAGLLAAATAMVLASTLSRRAE
jgi:Na+/proline symporter